MLGFGIKLVLWVGAVVSAVVGYLLFPADLQAIRQLYPDTLWWVPDMTVNLVLLVISISLASVLIYRDGQEFLAAWKARWLPVSQASKYFRDALDKTDLEQIKAEFDVWGKEMGTDDPFAMYFTGFIPQGVNLGILKVKGTPNNGLRAVKIEPEISLNENGVDLDDRIIGGDHRRYSGLQVHKGSILRYVNWLEGHGGG
ncbi:hypothetical protein [Roseovarius sp.]|uniref:hypothetical protein n=1 Tax=Roseovarius sp. TaxID=1486281 RepID=UPI003BACCCFB